MGHFGTCRVNGALTTHILWVYTPGAFWGISGCGCGCMGHFGAFRGVGVSVGVLEFTYLYKSPVKEIYNFLKGVTVLELGT